MAKQDRREQLSTLNILLTLIRAHGRRHKATKEWYRSAEGYAVQLVTGITYRGTIDGETAKLVRSFHAFARKVTS